MCILALPKEEFYRSIAVCCVCVCVWVCEHALCSVQSCLTLYSSRDCNPPGSSVHGIFQTRILEWIAISSSRGSSQPRDWTCVSGISCIARQILYQLSYQGSPHSVQEEFSSLSHKGSEGLRSYLQKVELKLSAGFHSYQEALGKNQLQDSFKLLAESSSSRL